METTNNNKISYVRKPLARRSFMSVGLAAAGLVLFAAGIWMGVRYQGQAPLNAAAVGFSSLLFSLVGLWYGCISFLEQEKNYILAKAGIGVSGLIVILWFGLILIGLRG